MNRTSLSRSDMFRSLKGFECQFRPRRIPHDLTKPHFTQKRSLGAAASSVSPCARQHAWTVGWNDEEWTRGAEPPPLETEFFSKVCCTGFVPDTVFGQFPLVATT